jgi:hypothetical protein
MNGRGSMQDRMRKKKNIPGNRKLRGRVYTDKELIVRQLRGLK